MIQYVSLILLLIGFYGLLTQRHLIKLIVSLNIMEVGLNLFIISIGYVKDGLAPILSAVNNNTGLNFVDPLPQSLVLTSIVIGLGVTALALTFVVRIHRQYGTFDLDELGGVINE